MGLPHFHLYSSTSSYLSPHSIVHNPVPFCFKFALQLKHIQYLCLTLPSPPHQPHDYSLSSVLHVHPLLRSHPPGMECGDRGRHLSRPSHPVPLPHPWAPGGERSALLLLFFFSNWGWRVLSLAERTSPYHPGRRKIRGPQSLDAQLGAISLFPRMYFSSSSFRTFSTTTWGARAQPYIQAFHPATRGVLLSYPLYFCTQTFY